MKMYEDEFWKKVIHIIRNNTYEIRRLYIEHKR